MDIDAGVRDRTESKNVNAEQDEQCWVTTLTEMKRNNESSVTFCLMGYLMSPSFLLIAEPMVEKAAEVFCPAWDSVSWVFLYLWEEEEEKNREW